MSVTSQVDALAARIATEFNAVRGEFPSAADAGTARVRNTDVATDINTVAWTDIPLAGATVQIDAADYAVLSAGIQCKFAGKVLAIMNVHTTSAGQRAAINGRFAVDGVGAGPIAATDYIRNNGGHDNASLNMAHVIDVTANQVITVQGQRAGTVADPITMLTDAGVGTSSLEMIRLRGAKGDRGLRGPAGDAVPFVAATFGATTTLDLLNENQTLAVTGNTVLAVANQAEGQAGSILLTLNGAHTVSFGSDWTDPPTIPAVAGTYWLVYQCQPGAIVRAGLAN